MGEVAASVNENLFSYNSEASLHLLALHVHIETASKRILKSLNPVEPCFFVFHSLLVFHIEHTIGTAGMFL